MAMLSDDRLLVTRIAGGDQAALRGLLSLHQVRVFRFLARRLRNDALAEDLTNDVFTEVWLHAKSFEGRSNVSTWLLSIAHNRMVSALRKRREESWDEEKAQEIADDGDTPEVSAQKLDKGRIMRVCVERLSPAHREIVDLVYYHEQSIAEVSTILGIPEATVKTRMFYARKQLSELLKAAGIDRGWP
jgi:RNA polymerase sigma-70 factor (ECF subfamily)